MEKNQKLSLLNWWGFLIALVALVISIVAGIGTRFDLWFFRISLNLIFAALIVGAIAAIISLAGIIIVTLKGNRHGVSFGIIGLVISLIVAGVPFNLMMDAKKIPAIHDITTDMENPPQFVSILPLRKNAANPSVYGGPDVAAKQQKAYPYIKPLLLSIPTDQAFDKALKTAEKSMWKIVTADRAAGRIEAVAKTLWMGFKDDIVIRIAKTESGSRVDIRSVSRVGKGDFGTNARRVRKFLDEMQK